MVPSGFIGQIWPESEDYLREQAAQLTARGFAVDTRLSYGGAAERILEESAAREAALIVMATHGRGGLGRLVFGGVAEAVLRRTTIPLLLVRAWADEAVPPPLAAQPRFLVPLDGSAFAEEALPVAVNLAQSLGGALVLLHAVSPFEAVPFGEYAPVPYPDTTAEREEAARRYLQDLVVRSATGGCAVQLDIRLDAPTVAIAEAAREHDVALVVMATHGRGALGRLALGSVADATLRHTRAPLLLIRPHGLRAASAPAHQGHPSGARDHGSR